jgi:hypothetical protein
MIYNAADQPSIKVIACPVCGASMRQMFISHLMYREDYVPVRGSYVFASMPREWRVTLFSHELHGTNARSKNPKTDEEIRERVYEFRAELPARVPALCVVLDRLSGIAFEPVSDFRVQSEIAPPSKMWKCGILKAQIYSGVSKNREPEIFHSQNEGRPESVGAQYLDYRLKRANQEFVTEGVFEVRVYDVANEQTTDVVLERSIKRIDDEPPHVTYTTRRVTEVPNGENMSDRQQTTP